MFWSGGKDSSLALHKVKKQHPELDVKFLVTTINQEFKRISMHGVRESMLELQAESIGIPLLKMEVPNVPDNSSYEAKLNETLASLKESGITHIIFGDIFLEDLKQYRLNILKAHDLTGVFPLWKHSTKVLIEEFIDLKFRTITCCISTSSLTEDWVGKEIDAEFVNNLPEAVDVCGENGEFHTFCFDGPIFKNPIPIQLGEKKYVPLEIKTADNMKEVGFWFVDIF